MANLACDSPTSAMAVIQNEIFETILQKIGSLNFEVRKEAIICVGNVLTCMPVQHLKELLQQCEADYWKSYFEGLTFISNENVIMSVLETIEHFGKCD
jgi:hypothetical protein